MHMYSLIMANHVLGYFTAILILTVPAFATLLLNGAGNFSFTPQKISDFWSSQGGNYTFGFKDVGDSGEYLLSIWHSGDPNKTAVWWAKFGDDPILKDEVTFRYSSTGSLELYNATGLLVWSSNTNSSYAELQDTGNLVLLDENKVSTVWQSFEDPRDSLMLVGLDHQMVANRPYLLQSRRNQTSYAAGRFHLATDGDENLYLHALDPISSTDFVYLYANMSTDGGFQIWIPDNGKNFSYSNPAPAERLTLDYDGNLRVYSWESNPSSWQEVWQIEDNKCMLGSPCGPFGICNVNDDAGRDVINCTCPPGYHDRVSGDLSQGCASYISFNASCGSDGGSGNYSTTISVMPSSDYGQYNDLKTGGYPNEAFDHCETLCLNNCACMAASYRNDNTCFLKGNSTTGYLLNGYSTDGNTLLIKVVTPISRGSSGKVKDERRRDRLIGVGVPSVVVAAGTVGCAWFLWRRRRSGGGRTRLKWWTKEEPDMVSEGGTVRFKYQELVEATNNFSEPLGEGGFGKVYKGWVRGKRGVCNTNEQQVAVAVKVLKVGERHEQGGERRVDQQREKQFRAEVSTLGKIHHVNLVRLLGYCTGGRYGEQRLLVYEYMEKGSLDRFLSAARMQQPLPWATRYSMALGIARGLAYLHHHCNPRILHCDIKPQNVLLDRDFSTKLADFGFARRFHNVRDSHLTMSGMRGTRGYMAPEWLTSDEITSKVDVYSFGILLLELVRGLNTVNDRMSLVDWALQSILAGVLLSQHAGHFDDAINVDEQDNQQEAIEKLQALKIGIWCVQRMPSMRPLMSHVVQLFEGTIAVEDPPDPTPKITITNLPPFLSDSDPPSFSVVSAR